MERHYKASWQGNGAYQSWYVPVLVYKEITGAGMFCCKFVAAFLSLETSAANL